MATATIVTRQSKALGIAQRHEAIPLDDYPGYYSVRDTLTGSGTVHIVTWAECDCPDFTFRDKHVLAVRETETALQQYAAGWDRQCRPACPTCGAGLESVSCYIGGHGYATVTRCEQDGSHYSRRG